MAPSHWPGWTDTAKLRVPLISLISFLFWLVPILWQKRRIDVRAMLPLSLGYAACVLAGQWLLYLALDRLAALGLSATVYPLAIGTCIAGFYLYSLVVLRERATLASSLGVLTACFGIILITLGCF